MLLNDSEILVTDIITPCHPAQVRSDSHGHPVISHGLSSFGYDLTLAPVMKAFKQSTLDMPGAIDPKAFDSSSLIDLDLHRGPRDMYFILPRRTYALGCSRERIKVPANVFGVCTAKSTYARCGLFVNTTPMEPGWEGYLTLELYNATDQDLIVYANEGIAQAFFLTGNRPVVTYADRDGKYQDQGPAIVTARM